MIAHINIDEKSFGDTNLYSGLELRIQAGEKLGLLGRNGTGKSTLFNIITGTDKDYDGEVYIQKNLVITSARQEHQDYENEKVIDYILHDLPEFLKLKNQIEDLPKKMGDNQKLIQKYSDALERFGTLGYYDVESEVLQALESYQISIDKDKTTIGSLSGGQKRLVELVKVQRARADLALIDEPTNHMDYVAKASFIEWLKSTEEAVVVISHDRDVLKAVDRIIEIRDGQADVSRGNYDDYLKNNTSRVSSEVNEYTITQSRITNLKSDVIRFQRLKEKARNPGTISRFKGQELKARNQLSKLQELEKPSFWIDKDSAQGLSTKMSDAYSEHKSKNIRINTKRKEVNSNRLLVDIENLSLGYDDALFKDISVQIRESDRLWIHGRNGVGKSTIVKTVIDCANEVQPQAKIFNGTIEFENSVSIGVYEQELDSKYLKLSLGDAIEGVYRDKNVDINDRKIKSLLSDYLFNPVQDSKKPMSILSGGQKARFQLINMLAGDPNILILDEPTNHLDLPSIEELEYALEQYHGAIIFISHDTYFTDKLTGKDAEDESVNSAKIIRL